MLRARRDLLGRTREEIAALAEVSRQYLYLIERSRPLEGRDRSTRPRRDTLIRWAAALDMDRDMTNHVLALGGYSPLSPPDGWMVPQPTRVDGTSGGHTSGEEVEALVRQLRALLQLVPVSDHRWSDTTEFLRATFAYVEGRLRDAGDQTDTGGSL